MRKIAVCTTFPNEHFNICAAEMLATFKAYWPEDIKIYIQLDEQPAESFEELNNKIIDILGEERCYIAGLFDDDQKQFISRWKDHKPDNYLTDVVKFSHKIFALEKCAKAVKEDKDILIWLDADVITKRPVTHEWLESVLPSDDEAASYLGRDGFYSECGFVAYNLRCGHALLEDIKDFYVTDKFKKVVMTGWTDCHIFDVCLQKYNKKNLVEKYKHGVDAIDVWPTTKLAERMAHRKGNRKYKAAQLREASQTAGTKMSKQPVVDSDNMNIKTRNCLDHEKICGNIQENLSQIRDWARLLSPTDQEIVICAAGPSLSGHIEEIKALQNSGAKVIAVKHAIDTLKRHGVKPWAVVLLDPRGHVEGFVKNPDPDPYYFVASMCDPSVVRTLNENKCKVIGYHALVNAGEQNLFIASDLPVGGGSATSTRSIGLFADMFGYRTFHLFGYDLCHYQKPDMDARNQDGQPTYMEVNIGAHTHGNKYITRTFWTEGQFLAQSNELKNLYKERKDINITVYGDGLAGWLYKHHNLHRRFLEEYNENLEKKRKGTPTLDEYVTAIGRGNELSRGV